MRFRDFRFLWLSAACNAVGFMGEQVALGWVMLQLTDSPFMVGAALGLRAVPFFFLGIVAGAVADMADRRKLMLLLNLGMVAVASCTGALLFSGAVEVWHLFLLAVAGGSIAALYQTLRQSFIYDVAGPGNAVSGLAYASLGMRIGQLAGSLSVGVLIAHPGPWAAYMLLAAAYLASAASLWFIPSRGHSDQTQRASVMENLKQFGAELKRNRALAVLVLVVAATEVLGFSNAAIFPSLARDVLKAGPEGLGILNAARASGAILMTLLVTPFGEVRRKGLALVAVLGVFGGAIAVLGFSPSLAIAAAIVALVGGMMGLSNLFSQSLMQEIVPNAMRGRAMGAWVVAVGTGPLGTLQVGALASALGVTLALLTTGSALLVVAVAAALLYPRLRKL